MILMEAQDIQAYKAKMPTYDKRTETFEGKEYIVVPVVMMVEGVHAGSRGPLYHSKQELGRVPDSWNGRPVVINHPQDVDGAFISANSPTVLESNAVGFIFNTHMKGSKLVAEAWLDSAKLLALSPVAFEIINESGILEVSIGSFTDEDGVEGSWQGEKFVSSASNLKPDHLAILPGGIGACSVEKGCGIRVNQKGKDMKKGIVINEEDFSLSSEDLEKLNKAGISINRLVVDLSLTKLMDRMYSALNTLETKDSYCYMVELFEDTVIYRKSIRNSSSEAIKTSEAETLWKQAYQIAADDSVEWVGAPIQVVQNITYRPVPVAQENKLNINEKEEIQMSEKSLCPSCEILVNALIANTETKFVEEDRVWLADLKEPQLTKLMPEKKAPVTNTEQLKMTKEQAFATLGISNPAEFEAQMQFGLSIYKEQVNGLVARILANTDEGVWSKEELEAMPFEALQKVAKTAKAAEAPVNYSMFGARNVSVTKKDEVEPMPTPGIKFDVK